MILMYELEEYRQFLKLERKILSRFLFCTLYPLLVQKKSCIALNSNLSIHRLLIVINLYISSVKILDEPTLLPGNGCYFISDHGFDDDDGVTDLSLLIDLEDNVQR
jgi:hypothetical protein